MDDFFTAHGCKSGCHFFPSCSEVNSKGYLEFDEPISARLERYPLFSILTSDIASLKVFTEYPCFQVKIYIIEMFVTVPPVGRCTKQLDVVRFSYHNHCVRKEVKSWQLYQILLVYIKNGDYLCFQVENV